LQRTEWIAGSETEYIAKAAGLAADPVALASIRAGLREMFKTWCEKQA
jgi:predicted O-linked N-acetylglucosamine transferase (SPINDLY family)